MPIRFRCVYCGQLLAIATRKAGQEVDCPKCSHPNKVPLKDEDDVPPPPHQESRISKAFESRKFDKWLGRETPEAAATPPKVRREESGSVDVESASDTIDRAVGSDSASAVDEPWRTDPEVLPTSRIDPPDAYAPSWISAGTLAVLAVGLLLITFALGILVGRNVFPHQQPVPVPATEPTPPPGRLVVEEPKAAPPAIPVANAFSIGGKIEYQAADGRVVADMGAIVLALPSQSIPPTDKRIAVEGIRPGDADIAEGRRRVETWGGRLVEVSPAGDFTLPLPLPQPYWILILSAHAPRADAAPLFPTDRGTIEQYFPDANALVGDREFLLVTKSPRPGAPLNPLNYCFGKTGR